MNFQQDSAVIARAQTGRRADEPLSPPSRDLLRVALIVGTLGQSGAEKQLFYMARALQEAGADIRVFSLRTGEHYEGVLSRIGLAPRWIGRRSNPLLRIFATATALWPFRPHIVQGTHFYCNPYVAVGGRIAGAVTIGAIRSDLSYEQQCYGRWTPWLLRAPQAIIANSRRAQQQVEQSRHRPGTVAYLPNAIDLIDFDARAVQPAQAWDREGGPVVAVISRLSHEKRLDRFLTALASARSRMPGLRAAIVGGGPERESLQKHAEALGLLPHGVLFLGHRDNVPALLRQAAMLFLTSVQEGFPNVLLEAMAARLPVVTTPAGDAALVVEEGVTGYVVPFDDTERMAERMLQLAADPALRRRLGDAGRRRAEVEYSSIPLGQRLLAIYAQIAEQNVRHDVLNAVAALDAGIKRKEASSTAARATR